jgi:hypothetical protein
VAPKYDGVVVAVHYKPDGEVDWVRTFLRRGAVFSDYIMLDRQTLIEHINSGKKYFTGQRKKYYGANFDLGEPVRVVKKNGKEILVVGNKQAEQDDLEPLGVI